MEREPMNSSTVPNSLPNISRPDVGLVIVNEWALGTPDRQRAAVDAAMAAWDTAPWPEGLLTHNCFLATDGDRVLNYWQWSGEEAYREFLRTDCPERVRRIDDAVPGIERYEITLYRLYRSAFTFGPQQVPGCVVLVSVEFEGADEQRQQKWVDTAITVDAESEPQLAGISGHFHLSTDGTRVLNYSEWTSEEAHREALARTTGRTDVREAECHAGFPGVKRHSVSVYHFYRSLACYRTGRWTHWRQVRDSRYLSRRPNDRDLVNRWFAEGLSPLPSVSS
jgi:heme-degrading monooxygenase HmoA